MVRVWSSAASLGGFSIVCRSQKALSVSIRLGLARWILRTIVSTETGGSVSGYNSSGGQDMDV